MSHRDLQDCVVRLNSDFLKVALRWLIKGSDWSGVVFRTDCTWTPALLAMTAMLWVWSDELNLVDRFRTARKIVQHLFGSQVLAGSYQAFTKVLRRWTDELILPLQTALRKRMEQDLVECWLVLGFIMFAVDGSRMELPRTRSHEQAYSSSRKRKKGRKGRRRKSDRKKSNSPQLWMTAMWHVGSGLPWDWRIGAADSSERAHLLAMLATLPPGALIAADAGFVGYEYVRAIIKNGRQILLRVGSNVRLLKNLGCARERENTVYLWPDAEAKRRQPPLRLRLVVAHNGKHPVYLMTSVLSTTTLSDDQVVQLYARRWGIEVFYRHLKQTFQRRKLRSASAKNALVELQWSLVGLWAMALYALCQLQRNQLPPRRMSIAKVLRAFRRLLRDYLHPAERNDNLRRTLCNALIDDYRRKNKASRDYPRKKQETHPGPPEIIQATKTQIERAKSLQRDKLTKGLTA